MDENEVIEVDRVVDKDGNTAYYRDNKARKMAENVSFQGKPVGSLHFSTIPINPADEFGGEWQLLEDHMLRGWYVYERVS